MKKLELKQMEQISAGSCLTAAVTLTLVGAGAFLTGGAFALILGPTAIGTALECLAEK